MEPITKDAIAQTGKPNSTNQLRIPQPGKHGLHDYEAINQGTIRYQGADMN